MTTVKYPKVCELCGQTVEIDGFSLDTQNARKLFCCAGCQSIYQLLQKIGKNANQKTSTQTTINSEEE